MAGKKINHAENQELLGRAIKDATFRSKLLASPAETLKQEGYDPNDAAADFFQDAQHRQLCRRGEEAEDQGRFTIPSRKPARSKTPMAHGKVLLAALPFAPVSYPSLALGLLKAAVAGLGVACDVRYFSLDYVEQVGAEAFEILADTDYLRRAGRWEWVFAGVASGEPDGEDLRYLTEAFRRDFPDHYSPDRLMALPVGAQEAASFIERCVATVDWRELRRRRLHLVVQQNLASLAWQGASSQLFLSSASSLAGRTARARWGSSCTAATTSSTRSASARATAPSPSWCRASSPAPISTDSGAGDAARRRDGATGAGARRGRGTWTACLIRPRRFLRAARRLAGRGGALQDGGGCSRPRRGCWWGAKHHCTFCGINGLCHGLSQQIASARL